MLNMARPNTTTSSTSNALKADSGTLGVGECREAAVGQAGARFGRKALVGLMSGTLGAGLLASTVGLSSVGLVAGAGVSIAVLAGAGRAPEPEPSPRRWELQFESSPLGIVSIEVPEVGPRTYFYMTYSVTNNSSEDVFFAPAFDLSDGQGGVARAGRDVPASVNSAIQSMTKDPLVLDQVQIIGELLQGPRNSKRGVVIWPVANMAPEEVTVYVSGLSGESRTITGPDGKGKFVLRKTVKMSFESPGNLTDRPGRKLESTARTWIMR